MSFIGKIFIRGSLALVPVILTIYPVYYFFSWLDGIGNQLIQYFFPALDYLPGVGVVLGIIAIFLLGLLMSAKISRQLFGLLELPLKKIPLVKSLYSAIKELTRYLAPGDSKDKPDKVVVVEPPDSGMKVVGFVIREDLSALPESINDDDRVAVYIPMSYQIGGFTLFLPRTWLTDTELSVESAMRDVLTGWMSSEK